MVLLRLIRPDQRYGETSYASPQRIKIMELSNKNFKICMFNMFKEIKVKSKFGKQLKMYHENFTIG